MPDSLRLKIGNDIRSLREKKRISQDELAQMMKVSRSTISKIENGKFSLTLDYLERFSDSLGFNVSIKQIKK